MADEKVPALTELLTPDALDWLYIVDTSDLTDDPTGSSRKISPSNVGVTDHTALSNIGTNTHAQIDTHIADATVHFTEGSITHANIIGVGTNSHAVIDSHIASTANPHSVTLAQVGGTTDHGTLGGLADDDHTQYILVDGTRAFTGSQTTQTLLPDTVQTRDLGAAGNNFRHIFGGIGVFIKESGAGSSTITLPVSADHGGVIGGTQIGAGPKVHTLQGGSFPAVACIGNAAAQGAGAGIMEATAGGSTAIGSAYAYGTTTATVRASGFAATAIGYAYGTGTSLLASTSSGSLAFGYANARAAGTTATIRASGPGSFATGLSRQQSGTGTTQIQATTDGSFAAGSIISTSSGLSNIQAGGFGSFAGGNIANANSAAVSILASGSGSFAHGRARGTGASNSDITASGEGSFAVGSAAPGTTISATASNSSQFGPGTNTQTDSLQVGGGGIRFKGTVGAPTTPQNGDFWVNAGYLYTRSNGITRKFDGTDI